MSDVRPLVLCPLVIREMQSSSSVLAYLSSRLYHLCHQVSRRLLLSRSVCATPLLFIKPSFVRSTFLAFANLHHGVVQAVLGAALPFVRRSVSSLPQPRNQLSLLNSGFFTSQIPRPNPSINTDRRDKAAPAGYVKRYAPLSNPTTRSLK